MLGGLLSLVPRGTCDSCLVPNETVMVGGERWRRERGGGGGGGRGGGYDSTANEAASYSKGAGLGKWRIHSKHAAWLAFFFLSEIDQARRRK